MKRTWAWRIAGIILFITIILGLRFSPVGDYLSFQQLKADRVALMAFVQNNYISSMILYVWFYILGATFFFPLMVGVTIFGGFLFGGVYGTILTIIGATTGATFAFLMARYLLGIPLHKRYANQLARFDENIKKDGTHYLLSLRFLVVVPFFLVNVLAGLTAVSLWSFIWTTSLGIIPGTLIFSYAGSELATIESVNDLFSWELILAFIGLAVLALMPLVLKKYFKMRA